MSNEEIIIGVNSPLNPYSNEYQAFHVNNWMSTAVNANRKNLSAEDKDRFFRMIYDYADLLSTVFGHIGDKPLLNHDKSNPFEYWVQQRYDGNPLHPEVAESNKTLDENNQIQTSKTMEEFTAWKKLHNLP
jgi:hypothetical protein